MSTLTLMHRPAGPDEFIYDVVERGEVGACIKVSRESRFQQVNKVQAYPDWLASNLVHIAVPITLLHCYHQLRISLL